MTSAGGRMISPSLPVAAAVPAASAAAEDSCRDLLASGAHPVHVRALAQVVGKIMSMHIAIGNVGVKPVDLERQRPAPKHREREKGERRNAQHPGGHTPPYPEKAKDA